MKLELSNGLDHVYQWDRDITATITEPEDVKEAHFRWGGKAVSLAVTDQTVKIPVELMQLPKDIVLWAYTPDHTMDMAKIPLYQRAKPDDYAYTPTEIKTWEQLDERIKALEDGGGVAGVSSVNGQTGDVTITAEGLGAATPSEVTSAVNSAWAEAQKTLQPMLDGKQNKGDYLTKCDLPKSPLNGKTIVFFGDSICAGAGDGVGGYAKQIQEATGAIVDNQGVSGATICTGGTSTTKIINVVSSYTGTPDYIVFEGLGNDYNQNCQLGEVEVALDSTLDTSTFCGALESICRDLINRFPSARLFGVIKHRSTSDSTVNGNGVSQKEFAQAFETVCEKYSIPYYNAYRDSGFVTAYSGSGDTFATKKLADLYTVDGDKTHPNAAGYEKYYTQQIITMLETGNGSGPLKSSSGDVDISTSYESGLKLAEINTTSVYTPIESGSIVEKSDVVSFKNVGFVRSNGTYSTASTGCYTEKIYLSNVTEIRVNVGGYTGACNVAFFDSSDNFLQNISIVVSTKNGANAYRYEKNIQLTDIYSDASYAVISSYHSSVYDAQYDGDNDFAYDVITCASKTTIDDVLVLRDAGAENAGKVLQIDENGKIITKESDKSLNITGATVGQTVKISAVDSNGVPTAWVPVDMEGGGENTTWADTLLAEGTLQSDVSVAYDTGVTLAQLRAYKSFVYLLKGASNTGLGNLYLQFKKNNNRSALDRGGDGGRIVVFEWADAAKTVLYQKSGFSGNPSMVAIGPFAKNGGNTVGYGSGQWNVVRYVDVSDVEDGDTLGFYCDTVPSIDYAFEIRGLVMWNT